MSKDHDSFLVDLVVCQGLEHIVSFFNSHVGKMQRQRLLVKTLPGGREFGDEYGNRVQKVAAGQPLHDAMDNVPKRPASNSHLQDEGSGFEPSFLTLRRGFNVMDTRTEERPGRRVESLGWLTESVVMPKKQRMIEGVGVSSAVELKAQLYKSQEEVKHMREGGEELRARKKGGGKGSDLFASKNAGVDERANRDKLQLKAADTDAEAYAALEKKAALYQKLVNGELPDEEEKEKYSVDFFRKGWLEDEREDMEKERRGEVVVHREDNVPANEGGGGFVKGGLSSNHKELIREVNKETKEAREQAAVLKQRRQSQAEKNREKLRQAFVKAQAEKAKKQQKQTKQKETTKGTGTPGDQVLGT